MKKRILLVIICFIQIGISQLRSQSNFEIKDTAIIAVTSDLSFDVINSLPKVTLERIDTTGDLNIIEKINIRLLSGDVIFNFLLPKKKTGFYSIQLLKVEKSNEKIIVPISHQRLYGKISQLVETKSKQNHQIIIANSADNFNPNTLSGKVTFQFKIIYKDYRTEGVIFGIKVKCTKDNLKKYDGKIKKNIRIRSGYGGQLIGATLSSLAFIKCSKLNDKSEEIYRDQYRLQRTKDEAQVYYDLAQEKYDEAKKYNYSGIALASATVLWWGLQKIVLVQKKNIIKCNCFDLCEHSNKPKMNLELFNPSFENPSNLMTGYASLGIRLNF